VTRKISFLLRGGFLMKELVTFNQLLNVSDAITLNAEKNESYNELLVERFCDNYDILLTKKKLLNLFDKFKSAKYLYNFPISDSIKMTPVYEMSESSHQRRNISQVENAVTRNLDKQILTTDIYYSILQVSEKLVSSEAIYFINTFLDHESEENIAEILNISKTYLQKIKKSCIVKMWVELGKYCNEDD
jgi:hypothetical protein